MATSRALRSNTERANTDSDSEDNDSVVFLASIKFINITNVHTGPYAALLIFRDILKVSIGSLSLQVGLLIVSNRLLELAWAHCGNGLLPRIEDAAPI